MKAITKKALLAIISTLLLANFSLCLMDRERYETLKSEATFDVIEYEEYLQIFAKKDFEQAKLAGEYSYQQELAYIETGNVEHVFADNIEGGQVRQLAILPDSYDTRVIYPQCFVDVVKDQLDCGGCW